MARRASAYRGNTISILRKDVLDITQVMMAEVLGVSQKTVSTMENDPNDRMTMDDLRAAYRWAKSVKKEWPDDLIPTLISRKMKPR